MNAIQNETQTTQGSTGQIRVLGATAYLGEPEPVSNKIDLCNLVNLLIDEAKREEQIIARIREAVERDEKDVVFNLAKELVGL